MNIITTEQMVCTTCNSVNNHILTPGRIYVVTTEKAIDTFSGIDLTSRSFIGDDGNGYLLQQYNDGDFISLEEYRDKQLNKIL